MGMRKAELNREMLVSLSCPVISLSNQQHIFVFIFHQKRTLKTCFEEPLPEICATVVDR